MQLSDFYNAVAHGIAQFGGPKGVTVWMRWDDWDALLEATGPPRHVREQEARERGLPVPPVRWPDGEIAGMLHGAQVRTGPRARAGQACLMRDGRSIEIPAGPFEARPASDWGRPLNYSSDDTLEASK